MCRLTNKRDRRQLSASLWRWKTVAKRDPLGLCWAFCGSIAMSLTWVFLWTFLGRNVRTFNYPTLTLYNVANPSPFYEDSFFCKEDISSNLSHSIDFSVDDVTSDCFSYYLTFRNCTRYNANSIGIIYADEDDDKIYDYEKANSILDKVFDVIAEAYPYNNEADGRMAVPPFEKRVFKSNRELNHEVLKPSYVNDQICFAMYWEEFDTRTDTYDFTLRYTVNSQIPTTKHSEEVKNGVWNPAVAYSYFGTGYTMITSLVTATLAKEQYDTDMQFELLYTSMNTGEFPYSGGAMIFLLFCFPFLMFFYADTAMNVLRLSDEVHEQKIQWILKINGMREVVEILKQIILFFAITILWGTVAVFLTHYQGISSIALGVQWFFYMNFFANLLLAELVINNGFKRAPIQGSIFKFAYWTSQFVISILIDNFEGGGPVILGVSSLFPMGMAAWIVKFNFAALNYSHTIAFGNLFSFQFSDGMTAGLCLLCGWLNTLIFILILAYIWPLYIAVDPDNKLSHWYPLTCECFKKSKQRQIDENDEFLIDEPLESQKARLLTARQTEPQTQHDHLYAVSSRVPYLSESEHQMIVDNLYEEVQGHEQNDMLCIRNLKKTYNKSCNAVDDLSLTVFKNEILVLLGHNGAGKTTTINILTGLERATKGKVNIKLETTSKTASTVAESEAEADAERGQLQGEREQKWINLQDKYHDVTDFISVCPQENVLCDKMTVKENIIFFCRFKDVPNIEQVIQENLELFGLKAKANTLAKNLSGGQKRKLQLCISLLGDSKLVLLDEPTSGMDPTARRETWDIIKQIKHNKIIILTTHYMDEAENLADRVAIISKGKLQCCGSSLFLKKRFGQGFFIQVSPKLDMDKQAEECEQKIMKLLEGYSRRIGMPLNESVDRESGVILEERKSEFSVGRSEIITNSFAGSFFQNTIKITRNDSNQLIFQVPDSVATHFPTIFEEIDRDPQSYGIDKYSIRVSTLEEVFIEIGNKEKQQDDQANQQLIYDLSCDDIVLQKEKPTFIKRLCATFKGTMASHYGGRYTCVSFCSAFIMLILLCVSIYIPKLIPIPFATYSSIKEVYPNFEPLDLFYNDLDLQNQSTASLMQPLVENQNGALNAVPQQWYQNTSSNLSDIITSVSYNLDNANRGAYYILDSGAQTNKPKIVIFGSLNNGVSFQTYGNLILEQLLNQQTQQTDSKINLSFSIWPLQQSVLVQSFFNPTVANMLAWFIAILIICYQSIMIHQFSTRVKSGFYDAMMQKGGTKFTYFLSVYLTDVLHCLMISVVIQFGFRLGLGVSHFWVLLALWSIADPLFIACYSYLTIKILNMPEKAAFVGLATFQTILHGKLRTLLASCKNMLHDTLDLS